MICPAQALIYLFFHVFAALHPALCYSAFMKRPTHYPLRMILCCCLLAACSQQQKKSDVLDLYELPRTGQGVRPAPVDNDSYYTQPAIYKGCSSISDAPSCGGG